MSGITITGALRHIAGPGPVDCTVSRQQAGRIVALSARVGNGSGEGQPIMDQDLGVSWSSRVSTGDHCKQGQQIFTYLDFKLLNFILANVVILVPNVQIFFFPASSSYTIQSPLSSSSTSPTIMNIVVSCFINSSDWKILFWRKKY